MNACTSTGSCNRIAADTVEGETPSDTGWRNVTKKRPSGCGQGKELHRCHEWNRAAFLSDCGLRPHLQFWSPQRHNSILWLLAHIVMCWMQQQRHISLLNNIDFLRRARWKSYCAARWMQQVWKCLSLSKRETVVRMVHGVERGISPPPHTSLECGCAIVSRIWQGMGNALANHEAEVILISYVYDWKYNKYLKKYPG